MSSLNIVSNFAAQVAQRNLANSNSMASGSIAKLSSGSRVLGASDDAAALAIGSRLRAEVASQQQASVNAGQAVSMLQIADGAMSEINNTLVRMQSLSVQAGSDQLGSVERGLVNTEFQQLLQEVERIAQDTEFNGQRLIDGGEIAKLVKAFDPGTDGVSNIAFDSSVADGDVFQYSYSSSSEVLTVTKLGVDGSFDNVATDYATDAAASQNLSFAFDSSVAADAVFEFSYTAASDTFTLTNTTTSDTATIDITEAFTNQFGTATAVPTGESFDIDFSSLGVTVTLTEGFDTTADINVAEATASNTDFNFGGSATDNVVTFASGLSDAALAALDNVLTNGQLTLAVTTTAANTVVDLDANANVAFGVDGAGSGGVSTATGDITGTNTVELYVVVGNTDTLVATIDTSGVAYSAEGTSSLTIDFNRAVLNQQGSSSTADQTVNIDLTSSLDTVAGTGSNLAFDQTLDVDIDQFGVNLTLDNGFDRTTDITSTIGAIGSTIPAEVDNASFAANTDRLTGDVYNALLNLGYNNTTGVGYNASTGVLSLGATDAGTTVTLDGIAGLNFGLGAGNASANVVGTGTSTDVSITLADGSVQSLGTLTADYVNTGDGALGTVDIQLGKGVFYNEVDENALTTDFTFKIGTGNESFDRITLSLNAVNQQALGINGTDVTTAANADAASTAIANAITTLNTARANVGAFQNRLDIAASNLATTTENTEAARSALLDLNVAQEMTAFTSNQILVQAGVSMLSQANQLPQNLLRLLQ